MFGAILNVNLRGVGVCVQAGEACDTTRVPYRGAHRVAHTEVKAALLIHGVVQAWELRQ